MAYYGKVEGFTSKANSDLTNKLYHVARAAGEGLVDQASHAAAAFSVGIAGVLQSRAASGEHVTVGVSGESKVVAGAAVTAWALLTTNSSGRAVAAASGDLIFGRAITSSGADGQVITACIFPPVRLSGAI